MAPRKPKPVAKDSRRIVFGESSAKGKTHYIMNILSHESLAKVDFRHVDAAKEKPRATKVLRKEWRTRRANRTKAVKVLETAHLRSSVIQHHLGSANLVTNWAFSASFWVYYYQNMQNIKEHQRTSNIIQHHLRSWSIIIQHHARFSKNY